MILHRPRIVIIGGGVNGLTCAYLLLEQGYSVVLIAEAIGEATTSAVAGALWELPPAVCGYPQILPSIVMKRDQDLSLISYKKFLKIAELKDTGVMIRPVNFYYEADIQENIIEASKLSIAEEKLLNFRRDRRIIMENGINPGIYKDAYSYDTPIIDTDIYLDWLLAAISAYPQMTIIQKKVTDNLTSVANHLLDAYNAKVIVNCSGLGSMELVDDNNMCGARGGLIYVDNTGKYSKQITQAHCTSLIQMGLDAGYFIFILPRGKNILVLGGVAEVGEYEVGVSAADYQPFAEILKSCKNFLPDLKNAKVLSNKPLRVGIRPFRKQGLRLEWDPEEKIIHNYGHGGAGVLLSWGCAQEVCNLVVSADS